MGVPVLRTSLVVVLAAVAVGCAGPGFHRRSNIALKASSQEELAEERLLSQPFAIAVPEDAIVRVVGPTTTCTGTVFEDDLVLTAHHCIVERGAKGEFLKKPLDASAVRVELGGDYFAWGEVGVRHIVTPPCGETGGAGDVAVLVLTRKLIGLTPMTVRTGAPPKVGEDAFAMGFGRCALSSDGIHRKTREGSPIRALNSETIHMDASICPGDSGGPVFAKGTREIIGVVSLAAMDHDEQTKGPALMARIDAYGMVFNHARMLADGSSPAELPPLECGTHGSR